MRSIWLVGTEMHPDDHLFFARLALALVVIWWLGAVAVLGAITWF